MTERISSGQTTALQEGRGLDKARGGAAKETKTDALKQRQAARADGAQLRTHTKDTVARTSGDRRAANKDGRTFFQRHFGKSLSPQQVRQQERSERRERLHAQGGANVQHKQNYEQARAIEEASKVEAKEAAKAEAKAATEAGERETRTSSSRGERGTLTSSSRSERGDKPVVEVVAYKKEAHGMRNRLDAFHALAKHTEEGKAVRFVAPVPTLPQRSAILREGHGSFFERAGAKFKDTMLRIFRPQQWQARQVALENARQAEFAHIKHYQQQRLHELNQQIKTKIDQTKEHEAVSRKIQAAALESVEETPPPRVLKEKLTYKSDPELLKNPDYVRERIQVLEEIKQKRDESETAAIAKTRAKFDEQQRRAAEKESVAPLQQEPSPRAQPAPAPRRSVQTDL